VPQENGAQKEKSEMHNSIQIIGNVGRSPEQLESRANGTPFTILSVATRRAWKNAQGEWKSKTDWHRVVCFNRLNDAASALRTGDRVFIAGSLLSNQYERGVGKGKKLTSIKLTSWQIRANVIRKLNRTAKETEAGPSGSQQDSNEIPF
jgi:single stranded DNA-binding protein